MQNGAHAAMGAGSGSLVALAAHQLGADVGILAALGYALGGAGAALLPDGDHDNSVMYTSGGPVLRWFFEALQALSRWMYRRTRRAHDFRSEGEHRYLLHSVPFAAVAGLLVGALGTLPWVGPVVLCLLLSPAIRSLSMEIHYNTPLRVDYMARHRFGAFCLSVAVTAVIAHFGGPHVFGPVLGAVVFFGMLTHNVGDSLTNSGIPWKALIPHRCDSCRARRPKPVAKCAMWDRSHLVPAFMRFNVGTKRGDRIERRWARGSMLVGVACLIYGWVWPIGSLLLNEVVSSVLVAD